jgi:hypothetical protein
MAKARAQVQVRKSGPTGRPVAEVGVSRSIAASDLGAVLQRVVTDPKILKAAGLKICDGCKSGLDLHIIDQQDVFQVEV